jgi:hypothetical protein
MRKKYNCVMSLITKTVSLMTYTKYRSFISNTVQPEIAQAQVWKRIRALLDESTFWKGDFNLKSSKLEDHDVTDYEFYRNSFENAFESSQERSPLNREKILYWAKSSGTSSKSKYFPITRSYQHQFQVTTPPLLHSLCKRFRGFMKKPVLYFASPNSNEQSPGGIEVGAMSNFNYRNIPPFLRRFYGFPIEVLKDSETFFKWGPLYALSQDLSAMIAVTPSMLIRFAEILEERFEEYLPYLEGKAQPPFPLPAIQVTPERLSLLKNAFRSKPFSWIEVWPSLQFVCCWKSSTCGLQLPTLEKYVQGQIPVVDATYSATEGWMTVPLETSRIGGVFHPGGHVVEFIAKGDSIKKENLLRPWELQSNQDYEVFLTTSMGLIRYRLYDIVRCHGFFNRSPILEFRQKSGNMLSLGQLRISEADLLESVNQAKFEEPSPWYFGPHPHGNRLALYCTQESASISDFLTKIQNHLCRLNPDFRDDLQSGLIQPISAIQLESSHPIWVADEIHAQMKPSILLKHPPTFMN